MDAPREPVLRLSSSSRSPAPPDIDSQRWSRPSPHSRRSSSRSSSLPSRSSPSGSSPSRASSSTLALSALALAPTCGPAWSSSLSSAVSSTASATSTARPKVRPSASPTRPRSSLLTLASPLAPCHRRRSAVHRAPAVERDEQEHHLHPARHGSLHPPRAPRAPRAHPARASLLLPLSRPSTPLGFLIAAAPIEHLVLTHLSPLSPADPLRQLREGRGPALDHRHALWFGYLRLGCVALACHFQQ